MINTVNISTCSLEDIENFKDLAQEHWDSFQNKQPSFDLTALNVFKAIKAKAGDKTVGYILYVVYKTPYHDELWCQTDMFYLQPAFRKQGIGKRMFQFLENEAKKQGACKMVSSFNLKQPLEGFYSNLGFTQTHVAVAKEI